MKITEQEELIVNPDKHSHPKNYSTNEIFQKVSNLSIPKRFSQETRPPRKRSKRLTKSLTTLDLYFHRPEQNELKFIDDYLNQEHALEDELETEQWYHKIRIDEIVALLFSFLSVGSGVVFYEARYCTKSCEIIPNGYQNKIIDLTLIFCSIGVLFYLLSLIQRYYHYFKLYKSAKYIENDDNFFQSGLWEFGIFDIVFAIIHPNMIFRDMRCLTQTYWNLIEVNYHVNDFLVAISLFRLFDWIRIVVVLTSFYSARADRVCKMFGMKLSCFYAFKCLLIKHTIAFQLFVSFIIVCSLGYVLKVIEGPVFDLEDEYPQKNNLKNIMICFWYMIVTMTTVGYGDCYTKSLLGRLVTFIIAIIGNILVAINISFFQSQTQLNEGEQRALEFIHRIDEKIHMKRAAAKFFKTNFQYYIQKKKYLRGDIERNDQSKKKLIQLTRQKLKLKKDFSSLIHQFQINYKMTADVDLIKKKISELEEQQTKMDEVCITIENKLQAILDQSSDEESSK